MNKPIIYKFYGVITTKIYCHIDCSSRQPLNKNKVYFKDIKEALNSGYRACKRCQPDKFKINAIIEFNKNIMTKLDNLILDDDSFSVDDIANRLKLSSKQLQRICKKMSKMTVKKYILSKSQSAN